MKTKILFAFLLFTGLNSCAQSSRPESYNFKRGLEAYQSENTEEALEFFDKDVKENPRHGYSYSWIAMLRSYQKEYGRALTAADMAIKYLPKKDIEYVVFAYTTRAEIHLCLEDTVKALEDYKAVIRISPENTSLYEKRAQVYYEQGQYELADADYKKMISLKPGDVMGYMGLGRNANARKRWNEAIQQFDYVLKLESDYSPGYSFRAEAYLALEKWNEATDDIVTAMKIDWDRKAIILATTVKEPAFTMLVSKMKVQAAKKPNEAKWPYTIGYMYEGTKQYEKAIKYYSEANAVDAANVTYYRIAACYFELGRFEQALNSIDQALTTDSTNIEYLSYKANIYYEMGKPKEAITEWDHVLRLYPDFAWGYYRRGWFKELTKDYDGAIEDLSMSIVLDPEYSYAYSSRGDIYQKQGKHDLAEADFRKIVEIEETTEEYACIHYAYLGLGMPDKAIETCNAIIARDTTDAGNYYDAACMYSRMKDKENAIRCLKRSLELGYARFSHIEQDYDLDFIRDTDEFKSLIKRYKTHPVTTVPDPQRVHSDDVSEIPFVKENGINKVKCQINGLPLHFVFDTGASDVTLSLVEANFMMKNGYITESDVVGNHRYMDANGSISTGTVLNLKSVTFGGCDLKNVRATVVRNQKAPLLLGQSVLSKLGRIEIDNQKQVLRISHPFK